MSDPQVLTAADVDASSLDAFLRRFFSPAHCDFLLRHGEWWHRGLKNRHVVMVDTTIAGYSSVIPAPCRLGDTTLNAHWWVDLVIDPAYRGRGLQSLLDRRVRHDAELLLGFPNALAAGIHRKHGWGVREDHRVVLLPFAPSRLRPVLRAGGARGAVLRSAARLLLPLARRQRRKAAGYRPATARHLDAPTSEALAKTFASHSPGHIATTARDADYLRWRYFEAPYRDEIDVYVAGEPSLAAIVRSRREERGFTVKVLDLFGALQDTDTVLDLLRLVARQAASAGAVELSAFVTLPHLFPVFRKAGFVLHTRGRSCWHSDEPQTMRFLDQQPSHWTFGDSDQEDPA